MLWRISRMFRLFFSPRPRFVIRVRNGRAEAVAGKVTRRFLSAVTEIARAEGIRHGLIDAMPRGPMGGRMVEFRFSPHFGSGTRQSIRNVYQLEL